MGKLSFSRLGCIVVLFCAAGTIPSPAQVFTTLCSFCAQSGCTDGGKPLYGSLVQGSDGNFYGTTYLGGSANGGTVFRITPSGTRTTLYSFCTQSNCVDGTAPYAGLLQGTDGNFYGATSSGGTNNLGTVFKITSSGTLTTLHSFDGSHGRRPRAALVQGSDGQRALSVSGVDAAE